MTDIPRDNLVRANFDGAKVEGRTLTGYPIVFDSWTEIDSYEGRFKERISRSALDKTLGERADHVKVLFNHGMDPQIGDKPLGKPTVMRSDEQGLYVEVPFSATSYNDDLLALIRDGAIDGQSFRFSVVQEDWETPKRGMPERTITELKLFEFGPVTFPAYEATTVGVRSRSDFEAWQGITDENREQIETILRSARVGELTERTSVDEAGEATSEREAAPQDPTEPGQATPTAIHKQRQLKLRAQASGVLPHEQVRGAA